VTGEEKERAREMREGGMAYKEIGNILGVSRTTVSRHLSPAIRERDAVYYAAHKEEKRVYAAAYRVTHKEESAAYRAAHRDEIAAHNSEYRLTHKDEMAAYSAEYRRTHKDKLTVRGADYRCAHRDEAAAYNAEYRRTHKDEIAEYNTKYIAGHKAEKAAYRAAHKAEYAAREAKRRALKAGSIVGAAIEQLAEIKEIYRCAKEEPKVRCYLCGEFIPMGHRQVDHIVPISKGGAHCPSNLAIACDECNLWKSDKMPEEIGILI